MKKILIVQVIVLLLLVAVTANAQRKPKRNKDNVSVFQELALLGKWSTLWPVQINLHIAHRSTPVMSTRDSADADMTLFLDQHEYYMQAEGMEQIANDTVLVMVNTSAHMIRVFPSNGLNARAKDLTSFMPDTSLEKLSKRFSATMQEEGHTKRIILLSREKVSGTDLEKELVNVSYNAGDYKPLNYKLVRRSVVPVDSIAYNQMAEDVSWKGRLISSRTNVGQLFFVVKEQVTECTFLNIDYAEKTSPVHEHDRVVKTANGEYRPAKGFEQYNLSQE